MKLIAFICLAVILTGCSHTQEEEKWVTISYEQDRYNKTCFESEFGYYEIDNCSQFDHNKDNKLNVLFEIATGKILGVEDND